MQRYVMLLIFFIEYLRLEGKHMDHWVLLLTGLSFSYNDFRGAQIPVLKESLKREILPEEQAENGSFVPKMVVPVLVF